MAVIPVSAREVSVHIHADRRLAFQVLTAFGAGGQNQASSKVLRRDEDRLLVEFHTPGISLTGGGVSTARLSGSPPRNPPPYFSTGWKDRFPCFTTGSISKKRAVVPV